MILASDNILLQIIAKSVSAGALVYISAVEIVNEEFIREKPDKSKYFAFSSGIGFMIASLIMFAE